MYVQDYQGYPVYKKLQVRHVIQKRQDSQADATTSSSTASTEQTIDIDTIDKLQCLVSVASHLATF